MQNIIEKIVQQFAVNLEKNHSVQSGDFVSIKPAYIMTHDNTGAVIPKFNEIGTKRIKNPDQVVIALDHNIQDKSEENIKKYKKIEDFAKKMKAHFYEAGRGIGHQIMCEEGFIKPYTFVVASDSHATMYGALGCLGTPVVRTDAASIWATEQTWWQIPKIAKVIFKGKLNKGVSGKDVIIALCGFFKKDEVLNHAIEFEGSGIKSLSIDDRLTVSNMATEWGALAAVFPVDKILNQWLQKHFNFEQKAIKADKNAFYAKKITLDLSTIESCVAGPNSIKTISKASEISKKNIKINKAYLLSCVNGRASDIEKAAKILKNKKIAKGVEFYLSAASAKIQKQCEESGAWQGLIQAGAIPLPSGCGTCIGLGQGLLKDGETGISATNRNFKGRMGSPNSFAYLASPEIVAYSALKGKIYCPKPTTKTNIKGSIQVTNKIPQISRTKITIIKNFPKLIEGNIVLCDQDNINTDAIFPGKYTYIDDLSSKKQAAVVMENYDCNFGKIAKKGDILVAGYNFGSGSSREQAATAFKHKGIKLIIAGSFSDTYKRNAINNGFLTIECPDLLEFLKTKFTPKLPTIRIESQLKINFQDSTINILNKNFSFLPISTEIQKIILK